MPVTIVCSISELTFARDDIAVACALNGIESERMALRLFDNVYGIDDYVFAAMLRPGAIWFEC